MSENLVFWCAIHRAPKFEILREKVPDDWAQTVRMTALELGKNPTPGTVVPRLEKNLWRLGRDLGFFIFVQQDERREKQPPLCGLCDRPGYYRDSIHGRLCRRHGTKLNKRKKLGWEDPYKGLGESRPGPGDPDWLPWKNKNFWRKIRKMVSADEWRKMWNWAKGKGECPTLTLEKIQFLISRGGMS